jgi:phasin
MNMNSKPSATKPAGIQQTDAPQVSRVIAEAGTTHAKETYGKISAAATEAADLVKESCSTAIKGAQDYNTKFIEFAHANTNSAFSFVQQLYGVKSPTEFVELSTEHARTQLEALTDQTKQLAALAQKVTLATTAPLKTGVAKAFNR